eukprot:253685_1
MDFSFLFEFIAISTHIQFISPTIGQFVPILTDNLENNNNNEWTCTYPNCDFVSSSNCFNNNCLRLQPIDYQGTEMTRTVNVSEYYVIRLTVDITVVGQESEDGDWCYFGTGWGDAGANNPWEYLNTNTRYPSVELIATRSDSSDDLDIWFADYPGENFDVDQCFFDNFILEGVVKGPDPECTFGIQQNGGTACCHSMCGTCSGSGCSGRPGGTSKCCGGTIKDNNRRCDDTYPPCVVTTPNPTLNPTKPTTGPTLNPTIPPTLSPTKYPTTGPTIEPTHYPTMGPTIEPTQYPTMDPTIEPTQYPTIDPTQYPTMDPTLDPTLEPTQYPTMDPTIEPTQYPTLYPTLLPTLTPSQATTVSPSSTPTTSPTTNPSQSTYYPSNLPTDTPTQPTTIPTMSPSLSTRSPSNPSSNLSSLPTKIPTKTPTTNPSKVPTIPPSKDATNYPSSSPTVPSNLPTKYPTSNLSSSNPSDVPTFPPSSDPTTSPSICYNDADLLVPSVAMSHANALRANNDNYQYENNANSHIMCDNDDDLCIIHCVDYEGCIASKVIIAEKDLSQVVIDCNASFSCTEVSVQITDSAIDSMFILCTAEQSCDGMVIDINVKSPIQVSTWCIADNACDSLVIIGDSNSEHINITLTVTQYSSDISIKYPYINNINVHCKSSERKFIQHNTDALMNSAAMKRNVRRQYTANRMPCEDVTISCSEFSECEFAYSLSSKFDISHILRAKEYTDCLWIDINDIYDVNCHGDCPLVQLYTHDLLFYLDITFEDNNGTDLETSALKPICDEHFNDINTTTDSVQSIDIIFIGVLAVLKATDSTYDIINELASLPITQLRNDLKYLECNSMENPLKLATELSLSSQVNDKEP